MNRLVFVLDLQEDPTLIAEYEAYHRAIWPGIVTSIKQAGITQAEIYRWHSRLCMILEVNDSFSLEQKAAMDAANPVVQEWEALMWKYQQALPGAKPGEKWQLMDRIFVLS